MAEYDRLQGVLPEETVRPVERVPQHMASGSGWEPWRGGGRVPASNPWRESRPHDNPAQLGIGLLGYRGPERRSRWRR